MLTKLSIYLKTKIIISSSVLAVKDLISSFGCVQSSDCYLMVAIREHTVDNPIHVKVKAIFTKSVRQK